MHLTDLNAGHIGALIKASCTDAPPASEGVHLSTLLIQEAEYL